MRVLGPEERDALVVEEGEAAEEGMVGAEGAGTGPVVEAGVVVAAGVRFGPIVTVGCVGVWVCVRV